MEFNTSRLLAAATRSVKAGDQEVEEIDGIDITRLLLAANRTAGVGAVSRVKKRDVGVVRAFGAGVEKGIQEPFRLLGIEPSEVELDATSEVVANFLGTVLGFGIGFIPFLAVPEFAIAGFVLAKDRANLRNTKWCGNKNESNNWRNKFKFRN